MTDSATILAVDDTTESLALLGQLLTAAGFVVRLADSGELALAAVAVTLPDLILLDLRMPGLGGLEVCRRLKADPRTGTLPIILLSAFAETEEWAEGLRLGAADYVVKPFRPEELLHRVQTQLALAKARQRHEQLQATNTGLAENLRTAEQDRAALRDDLGKATQLRQVMLSVLEDQRQAEAALRDSQASLAQAMELAQLAHWELDVATTTFTFNDRFYALYGTTAEREGGYRMAVDAYFREFLLPEETHRVADEVRRALDSATHETSWHIEHRIRRRDGGVRHISVHIAIRRDSAGRATVIRGANQDITDRIQTADVLRRTRERLELAQHAAGLGSWDWDIPTNQVEWSTELFDIFGLDTRRDTASLEAWRRVVHPDDQAIAGRMVEQAIKDGTLIEYEYRIVHPDGSTRWIYTAGRATYLADRQPVRMSGICLDVTNRKAVEAALQHSEALFRSTFDEAPVGAAIVGLDQTFRRVNAALCRFLGFPAEELLGKTIAQITHPDDVVDSVVHIRRLLGGETTSFEIEKRYLRKDGAIVWGRVSVSLVRDASGRPLHLAPIIQDITARKQAEAELRQTQAILQVAMDQSPAGIAIADAPSGTLRYVNDAGLLIRGGDRATIVNGVGVAQYVASWQLLDFDGRPLRSDEVPLARAVMLGERSSREFIVHRGDNDDRVVLANAAPIRDDAGTVVAAVVVFLDITEQKRAERDLEQFFALVPDMVCIASAEGFFRKLNDEWTRVLGYSKEELMAVPYTEFVHPEDRAATHEETAQEAAGNSTASFVNRYRAKDGSYRWLEWNATAATSKGILFAAARDVTEHRQAEELVRENELRYRTLANSGPGLVWTSGLDKKCDYFNQTWLNFTGRRLDQELGDGWTEGVHPDDFARCVETYVTAFDRHEPFSMDYRLRRHDGEYRWIQDDGSPRYDGQGTFLGYIGHCLDITERKVATALLRQKTALLEAQANSTIEGILVVDEHGQKLLQNRRLVELWKMPPAIADDPDDQTQVRHVMQRTKNPEQFAAKVAHLYSHPQESSRDEIELTDGTVLDRYSAPVIGHDGRYHGRIWSFRDITDLKQAESALRESEEKFAKVFHDAPVWIAITDMADATYLDVNEAVLHAAGFTREEVIGHTAAGIGWIRPEDRTRLVETIREHGRIVSLEMAFHTKDGRILQGLVSGEPISIGGRPRLLTVTIDITARKRAEEELANTRTTLEAAFEQTPIPMVLVSMPDAVLRFVNSASRELLGILDEPSPAGLRLTEFTPPYRDYDDQDNLTPLTEAPLALALRGQKTFNQERRIVAKDGTSRWAMVSANPIYNTQGTLIAAYLAFPDITERKRADDDRRRSHELLAKLTAQVPGVVYQYRIFPDGRSCFPFSSPGMQTIYEYTPEEVRTDATPVFGRLHPEDAGAVSAAILESARTLAPFHCEFRVVLPRQGVRWRLSDAVPERTEDGGTLWYGIISDITERRLAEELLRESLREKEALLKEVHHRVKNNLQIISSLLRLQAAQIANPAVTNVLQDMQGRIRSMALLHETLYRSGNLARVDLADYLQAICFQLQRAHTRHDSGPIRIRFDLAAVQLDATQAVPCGLLVNELVANCLKHAFPGGRPGEVLVRLQPATTTTAERSKLRLSVTDNGVGLPADLDVKKLRSLGLQLVTDLSRQLQGTLETGAGPEGGAAFTVEFAPFSGAEPAPSPPAPTSGPRPPSP